MFEGVEESVRRLPSTSKVSFLFTAASDPSVSSTEVFNEAMMNDFLIDFCSQTFFTHSVCLESVA